MFLHSVTEKEFFNGQLELYGIILVIGGEFREVKTVNCEYFLAFAFAFVFEYCMLDCCLEVVKHSVKCEKKIDKGLLQFSRIM